MKITLARGRGLTCRNRSDYVGEMTNRGFERITLIIGFGVLVASLLGFAWLLALCVVLLR